MLEQLKKDFNEEIHEESNESIEIPPPQLNIYVAPDKMTAYVRVLNYQDGQTLEVSNILDELEKKEIRYGIQNQEIGKYCFQQNFRQELKVAVGLRPVKGDDGKLQFGFETVKDHRPKLRPDGTVDFRELNLIENVVKDQLLCTVIPPTQGTPGINVYGAAVEAKPGSVVPIGNGTNTYLSEDKLQIFSAVDGGALFKSNIISVEEIFVISDDVGVHTGNIQFNGSVLIKGNVLEGFTVVANKDIEINGMVEGASLSAGGNILIKGGVNGMRKTVLRAEGNLTTKFIQNASVIVGRDLCCDVIVNGYIKAGRNIVLRGEKAALIGGEYLAGEKIIAKTIGTENNLSVNVTLAPNWFEMEKLESENKNSKNENQLDVSSKERLEREINNLEEVSNRLRIEIESLCRADKSSDAGNNKNELLKKFMAGKAELAGKINDLKNQLKKIKDAENIEACRIICIGILHPGVKITIGTTILKVDIPITGQHFYIDKGEIQMGAVLPHEIT